MAALATAIGFDELVLAVGLVMVAASLWPAIGRLALLLPGAVLVWISLPAREPFVAKPADELARRKR